MHNEKKQIKIPWHHPFKWAVPPAYKWIKLVLLELYLEAGCYQLTNFLLRRRFLFKLKFSHGRCKKLATLYSTGQNSMQICIRLVNKNLHRFASQRHWPLLLIFFTICYVECIYTEQNTRRHVVFKITSQLHTICTQFGRNLSFCLHLYVSFYPRGGTVL